MNVNVWVNELVNVYTKCESEFVNKWMWEWMCESVEVWISECVNEYVKVKEWVNVWMREDIRRSLFTVLAKKVESLLICQATKMSAGKLSVLPTLSNSSTFPHKRQN